MNWGDIFSNEMGGISLDNIYRALETEGIPATRNTVLKIKHYCVTAQRAYKEDDTDAEEQRNLKQELTKLDIPTRKR